MTDVEATAAPQQEAPVKPQGKDASHPESDEPVERDSVYGPMEDEWFGKRIRKSFGERAFWGTVVTSYVVGNGVFYKVSFDDGDVDILSAGEIEHDLAAAKRHADEDIAAKEPESEGVVAGGPVAPTRTVTAYVDALRTKKASLKRRRDCSDTDNTTESSSLDAWQVKLWSVRLFAVMMEEDGYIRLQDFVSMPNGEPGEMESSGKVKVGDALIAVQDRVVHGVMDHTRACELIRNFPRPLTLTFIRAPKTVTDESSAAVAAAVEAIQLPSTQVSITPTTGEFASKKLRVDDSDVNAPPPTSQPVNGLAEANEKRRSPLRAPNVLLPQNRSRPPTPEVENVDADTPTLSSNSRSALTDAPDIPHRASAVPQGPRVPLFTNQAANAVSHTQRLGVLRRPDERSTRTPSPEPEGPGLTGTLQPRSETPSYQQTPSQGITQDPRSSQLPTVMIPAHVISSTPAPMSSSSHPFPPSLNRTLGPTTAPRQNPPDYPSQAVTQTTQFNSRGFGLGMGVNPSERAVFSTHPSYRRFEQVPVSSAGQYPNRMIHAHNTVSLQDTPNLGHPRAVQGGTSPFIRVAYSYQGYPATSANFGHQSYLNSAQNHQPPSISGHHIFPINRNGQFTPEEEQARVATLGDYMMHTANQERLALRAAARESRVANPPSSVQSKPTVSSTSRHHSAATAPSVDCDQLANSSVEHPAGRVPSPPREIHDSFDLGSGVDGRKHTASSMSLDDDSFLEDIPVKQRASRVNGLSHTSHTHTSANSGAPPRPLYLRKYDADGVVEVTITQRRLYVTLAPMGQYIAVSTFVRGDAGEVGEIEASGKVLTGDVLVGIGATEVSPSMTAGDVAQIVTAQPRPYSVFFIRSTWEMLE